MLVTNVGGLPEMVPNDVAGVVCEPNANSIAAGIQTYLHKGKAHYMPGLLQEKQQLSWEKLVEQILEV